ncbi:YhgE/Pip domain-containing protein [Alkalihalobacterium elongatum]|uniref:YhgE/Pip domain-containing protein n=1 Tax=Alkalihalobacterium elongatum TaxID=2675466 RepID=UPI001C1F886A|nr:DUF3533 domain-containing protein [Alkalihalobacterium elongatum]
MKKFILSKNFIGVIIFVFVIQMLLAYASFGPVIFTEVKNLPIGFISSDTGEMFEQVESEIMSTEMKEVEWVLYSNYEEMMEGLEKKEVYGALHIPVDFTSSLSSLMEGTFHPVTMDIFINEGMNLQGAQIVSSILEGVVSKQNAEIRNELLVRYAANDIQVSPDDVLLIGNLVTANTTQIHAPSSSKEGQLPMIFTVLIWLGSLIGALMVWLGMHRPAQKPGSFVSTQLVSGLVLSIFQTILAYIIVNVFMGLEVTNAGLLLFFILLTAFVFFLIQSSVLNWFGFKGWPILIIIWLFGPALVQVPPEMLSNGYYYGVYSWIPIRFHVEGFKDILFFNGGGTFKQSLSVVMGIGIAFLLVITLSIFSLRQKDLTKSPLKKRMDNQGV